MKSLMAGWIGLALLLCISRCLKGEEGEILVSGRTMEVGKYKVTIEPSGRIREVRRDGIILLERLGLFAYPVGSGRLSQGGNPPECIEKVTTPTRFLQETGKFIIRREAILGNEKFSEGVKYSYKAVFDPGGKINIAYEVEYLVSEKWRAYAGEFIYRIPLVSIAGKGWIAEMRDGAVNSGVNPSLFNEENRKEWVHIDNGARLFLETGVGQVELIAEGKSYLRGGIEGDGTAIYVISLPREPQLPAGTKQSLQLTIVLPAK